MDEQVEMKTAPLSEWQDMEESINVLRVKIEAQEGIINRYKQQILLATEAAESSNDTHDSRLVEAKDLLQEMMDTYKRIDNDEDLIYRANQFIENNS